MLSGTGRVKLDDEVVDVRAMDAIRVTPSVTRAFESGPERPRAARLRPPPQGGCGDRPGLLLVADSAKKSDHRGPLHSSEIRVIPRGNRPSLPQHTPVRQIDQLSYRARTRCPGQGRDPQPDRQLQGARYGRARAEAGSPPSSLGVRNRGQLRAGPRLWSSRTGRDRATSSLTPDAPAVAKVERMRALGARVESARAPESAARQQCCREWGSVCSWSTDWIPPSPRAPERSACSSPRRVQIDTAVVQLGDGALISGVARWLKSQGVLHQGGGRVCERGARHGQKLRGKASDPRRRDGNHRRCARDHRSGARVPRADHRSGRPRRPGGRP